MIGLFKASENARSFSDTLTAGGLLTRGVTQANAMSAQPELQAQMFDVIGQLMTGIGELDKARPLLERALAMRRKLYGEDHPDVATTLDNLADVAYDQGDLKTAVTLRSEELAIRRKLFGNSDVKTADALFDLASDLHAAGNPRAGDSLFTEWVARVAGAPREVTPTRPDDSTVSRISPSISGTTTTPSDGCARRFRSTGNSTVTGATVSRRTWRKWRTYSIARRGERTRTR